MVSVVWGGPLVITLPKQKPVFPIAVLCLCVTHKSPKKNKSTKALQALRRLEVGFKCQWRSWIKSKCQRWLWAVFKALRIFLFYSGQILRRRKKKLWLRMSILEIKCLLFPHPPHVSPQPWSASEVDIFSWQYNVCVYAHLLSHAQLSVTPQTVARKAPLSMRILQARILEWVAYSFSRGSSQPKDQTWVFCISCIAGGISNHWTIGEAR